VRIINPRKHRALSGIDHAGAEQAHIASIPHVEDVAKTTVIDDHEAGGLAEWREIGIEDDGLRHTVIVLGMRLNVNAAGEVSSGEILSTLLTFPQAALFSFHATNDHSRPA
jgi:hypothetical protein